MHAQQLFGFSDTHIQYSAEQPTVGLRAEVWLAYAELCDAAKAAGFDPAIASGFRNFERQCLIWNGKASGERVITNDACEIVDVSGLSDAELVHRILRFSAIPGTSRHHWGTDFDIYDAGAMPAGYELQLTGEECCEGGVFAAFHAWLDVYLTLDDAVFFRPYAKDRGGIAAEPWHLSYAPLARKLQWQANPENLKTMLSEQELALKAVVLDDFDALYQRYIDVPLANYPQAWQSEI